MTAPILSCSGQESLNPRRQEATGHPGIFRNVGATHLQPVTLLDPQAAVPSKLAM